VLPSGRVALLLSVALSSGGCRAEASSDVVEPIGAPGAAELYTLGDTFGRERLTAASLVGMPSTLRRAALATASVGRATGFYIGKFAGAHVVATNHHVVSTSCGVGLPIRLPLLAGVAVSCQRVLGTWPSIDLTLLEIGVAASAEPTLLGVAGNFTFDAPLRAGQPLATLGFGFAGNPDRSMTMNQDHDCRVMSKTDAYRRIADPDTRNPGWFEAWSFSFACDVSYGDSGSAVLDRDTGLPTGILWTAASPKEPRVQSSAYLETILGTDHPDVWAQMSYAVPAAKIREVLRAEAPSLAEDTRTVVEAMLARPGAGT